MKLKIKVSKEIIHACRNVSIHDDIATKCPIAVAVRALFPKAKVQQDWINLLGYGRGPNVMDSKDYNEVDVAYLPLVAKQFIIEFDNTTDVNLRLAMEPIEFEIDIPLILLEQVDISEVKMILADSQTMELV